jgi:hypothetical protein
VACRVLDDSLVEETVVIAPALQLLVAPVRRPSLFHRLPQQVGVSENRVGHGVVRLHLQKLPHSGLCRVETTGRDLGRRDVPVAGGVQWIL